MGNPRVLLCDTDALIQLFLTVSQTKLTPLRMLKDDYGIQPAIVAEVEVELQSNRKFASRIAPELRKALVNGTIELLDASAITRYVPDQLGKVVFANCQTVGQEYNRVADRGEAYTLATAVTLQVPALSNDLSALEALDYNGLAVPSPVLRAFDLLVFCYQAGALSEGECDGARKELARIKEHLPQAFQHASFGDGVNRFCPRILDDGRATVGRAPRPGPAYTAQIRVKRRT